MPAAQLIKKVRISRIVEETPGARTFMLEPLEGWQPVWQSGQFITLVFETAFGEKRRSYSIPASPEFNEPLCFTVKRMTNGEFSRKLVDHAKVGDVLFTSGISGFFRLPERPGTTGQVFFLAAGSGITPCFALIKTLLLTTQKQVVLIYSNRSASDTIFHDALQKLQDNFPGRIQVRFLYSQNNNVYHGRLSKWLLLHLLDEYLKTEARDTLFYMCGPFEYMQTITITLLGFGIPANNIKKEIFDTTPRLVIPTPPDKDPHKVIVELGKQQYRLTVQYPVNILAAAKKQHIDLPYSCEAGRCGTCIATCTSGKIWMAYNEVLTDEEVKNGRILVCQAYPVNGDAHIVFDEQN